MRLDRIVYKITFFSLCVCIVLSIVTKNWLGLFCNAIWAFVVFLMIRSDKIIDKLNVSCFYLDKLNDEYADILRDIAIETQRNEYVNKRIDKAKEAAENEINNIDEFVKQL